MHDDGLARKPRLDHHARVAFHQARLNQRAHVPEQLALFGFTDGTNVDDVLRRVAVRGRPLTGQHELEPRHRMAPLEFAERMHQQADVLGRILPPEVEHVVLLAGNERSDALRVLAGRRELVDTLTDHRRFRDDARTEKTERDLEFALAVEEQSLRPVHRLADGRQVRVRLVVQAGLQIRPLGHLRDSGQRRSVQIRNEDDRVVVTAVRSQIMHESRRVDVLVGEDRRIFIADRADGTLEIFRFEARQDRVDAGEGAPVALGDFEAAHGKVVDLFDAGAQPIARPVVVERRRARRQDVDAVSAGGEVMRQLPTLLFCAAAKLAAEPRRDDRETH